MNWHTLAMVCLALVVLGCTSKSDDSKTQATGTESESSSTAGDKADVVDNNGASNAPDGTELPGAEAAAKGGRKLLVAQAQFERIDGKLTPGPAKLTIYTPTATGWTTSVIEDPESNVFHKAFVWRDGILTLGAMKARLVHWKASADGGWTPDLLWEKSWGGDFDRLRDIEIGDVDADGADELVIATHDQGVVAVGDEGPDGWTFLELSETPDTFVHEVEIGDVDGDGKLEFYVTASGRNRTDLKSQAGSVDRYDFDPSAKTYTRTEVVGWAGTHAKEILVTDLDGDGRDELYVAREAKTEKREGSKKPVKIEDVLVTEMTRGEEGWSEVSTVPIDDQQLRFLVADDIDGDGKKELVASAMKSGIWRLDRSGPLTKKLIAGDSGGFEHATVTGDGDGDGTVEIYVASDRERELRRYHWDGSKFAVEKIGDIPPAHITWNLSLAPSDFGGTP